MAAFERNLTLIEDNKIKINKKKDDFHRQGIFSGAFPLFS